MNETQIEGSVNNPIAGSSNTTSEPETIFIQVRRSQRKGISLILTYDKATEYSLCN